MSEDTLFDFPCRFPIKVMGRSEPTFRPQVAEIVRRHAPELRDDDIRANLSRAGRFESLTLTITATDRKQLDRIYQDLTQCSQVLMAL